MSTFELHFQHAAALNREGVSCLSVNDGNGAYRSFKLALEIMTEITVLADDLEDVIMEDVLELTDSVPVPLANDSSHYVYSRALLFQPPAAPSKRAMVFCVSVLIFNMALTYHKHGITKAVTLYGQVLVLLQDTVEAGDNCSSDSDVRILQVLAQNNQVHMLSMAGAIQQATDGCEAMRLAVGSLELADTNQMVAVNDDILSEIILNLLIPSTSRMAAAA